MLPAISIWSEDNPTFLDGAFVPCLDVIASKKKFRDGDLDEVYRDWLTFFNRIETLKLEANDSCLIEGYRYLGVLHLFLMHDSTRARAALVNVVMMDSRRQMWDLMLNYELQAVWDGIRENYGYDLDPAEIWQGQWLPPPKFERKPQAKILEIRKIYHDNRLRYALAIPGNSSIYDTILVDIFKQPDPAFILMKTEVKLRLARGPSELRQEISRFNTLISDVINGDHMIAWYTRLNSQIKLEEAKSIGLEKRTKKKQFTRADLREPLVEQK